MITYNFETVAIDMNEMINTPINQLNALMTSNIAAISKKLEQSGHTINWFSTRQAKVTLSGKTVMFVSFNITRPRIIN